MGGKALKNTKTRRYSKKEFEVVSKELVEKIRETFNMASTPLYFRNKESFGDIDIIVDMGDGSINVREYIEETFNPNEIFHNGNCYSFDYKEVQVDFMCVKSEHYDSNFHYLAYNDLGNYLGRLAHSIGLRYGQEGLWLTHYSDANTKHKIMISKDYRKIFNLLGLNYDRWISGFDTLEEIFEYVLTSPLFNPEMFQLNELNRINRERNLKRASYMAFLEFIKDKDSHPDYDPYYVSGIRKGGYLDLIRDNFPEVNIDLTLAEISYESAKKRLIKLKFNGGIIMKRFNLKGKELGDSIKNFKKFKDKYEIDGLTFDEFIINNKMDYIYKRFEQSLNEGVS